MSSLCSLHARSLTQLNTINSLTPKTTLQRALSSYPSPLDLTQNKSLFHPAQNTTTDDDEYFFSFEREESDLWFDFVSYTVTYNKTYPSLAEESRRYTNWLSARLEVKVLNEAHGPCPLTKNRHIFGFNYFSDHDEDEFDAMLSPPPPRGGEVVEGEGEEGDDGQKCGFWCAIWKAFTRKSWKIGEAVDVARLEDSNTFSFVSTPISPPAPPLPFSNQISHAQCRHPFIHLAYPPKVPRLARLRRRIFYYNPAVHLRRLLGHRCLPEHL